MEQSCHFKSLAPAQHVTIFYFKQRVKQIPHPLVLSTAPPQPKAVDFAAFQSAGGNPRQCCSRSLSGAGIAARHAATDQQRDRSADWIFSPGFEL